MLYIKKLCIENKIYYGDVCKVLDISKSSFFNCLMKGSSISISTLLKFKDYCVCKNILTNDFDVGDFFNDVD